MSFRLLKRESISDGIKRAALEQIDQITGRLSSRSQAKSIHEARKSLKRLRALLRLVRTTVGERAYRQENRSFRKAARTLAPLRDQHVLRETTRRLLTETFPETERESADRCERELFPSPPLSISEAEVASIHNRLLKSRDRIAAWPIAADCIGVFRGDLRRVYRKGRRSYDRALRRPTEKNLHAWRISVKHLSYLLTFLKSYCPSGSLIQQLDDLSETLGEEHDLAQLQSKIQKVNLQKGRLLETIKANRCALQKRALAIGDEVFSTKPKPFIRSILAIQSQDQRPSVNASSFGSGE